MAEPKKVRTSIDRPIVESAREARQGVISGRVLTVLIISTIGAFVVLALLYFFYFGLPFGGSNSPSLGQ